ncbi:MAG: endopeptidase La [Ruminococcaceae bacterium]|nr:endopeptidase La [Oscillospiraceae bacterium]
MTIQKRISRVQTLPMIALRGLVVYPDMELHFDVGRKRSMQALHAAMNHDQTLFLVTQRDTAAEEPTEDELYTVGVVAQVRQVLRLPGDNLRVVVEGLYRARLQDVLQEEPYFLAMTKEAQTRRIADPLQEEALVRECRSYLEEYAELTPAMTEDAFAMAAVIDDAGHLADHIAFSLPLKEAQKQDVLATMAEERRMEKVLDILQHEIAVQKLENRIHDRVHTQMDENQRDYYLREQLRAINEELGDGDNPAEEADTYRRTVNALPLSEEVREKLLKECGKLAKMPSGSQEAAVVRGYLDACLALPWGKHTEDVRDIAHARAVLDRDHYGMDKVKDRIVESLAVRVLSREMRGQILCFVGPPGVGKTSVARSIAEAMGRQYVRISLGGVRDEAEIRGHRKTYIGSMPGRIIAAVTKAKTCNPLILLDEIDKLGHDFRGDPAAAMLEVLDPEQNVTFTDHYLEIPFDLSEVLFITTANDEAEIPAALADRMDIIHLPSYTAQEKFHIAKDHLLPKQRKRHGISARQLRLSDTQLRALIDGYTREAGVRKLERRLADICRKAAKRIVAGEVKTVTVKDLADFLGPVKYKPDTLAPADEVGVVNGLAWTSVGGEMLQVEVAVLDGTGKVELTGSLGDVMKESARTAMSYVRSRAAQWGIDADFYKTKDIHVHVPEGAVPKDGPSAGVTMATAMVSALSGIPVRHDVAMTGEITLRGRVLPIGGLREKSMAAYTRRMQTVLVPQENAPDLAEVDAAVRDSITFVPVAHMDTVLDMALRRKPHELENRGL